MPTDNRYKLKYPGQHKTQDAQFGFIVREGTEQGALIGHLTGVFASGRESIIGTNDGKQAEGAGESPADTLADLEALVTKFLAKPIIKNSYPPEKKAKKQKDTKKSNRPSGPIDRYVFQDLSIETFEEDVVYRNPVILRGPAHDVCADSPHRPNYYAITKVIPNPVSLLNFGNTFSTQLLFYVASHILSKVSVHFDLDAFYRLQTESAWKNKSTITNLQKDLRSYDKEKDSDYKLYLKKNLELERLLESNRFIFTCGSYLHGGSYPPHKTHREGRHFDLSMGPDLMPWRTTKLREALLDAYNYLRGHPLADPSKFDEPRFKSTIYLCERSASDVGKKTVPLLDHEFMRKLVDEVSNKVVDAKFEPNGNTDYVTYAEGSVDAEREIQRLYGTPYFITSDDAELGHIGTLCIVLSAPTNIIYASPIVVLRCFRSLLRAVQQLYGQQLYLNHVGVTDIVQLDTLVRTLLRSIDIVFLPSDHHHHWHLDYPSIRPASLEKARSDRQKARREFERMEVRLEVLTPLWLLLDVDLASYHDYLLRYKKGHLLDKNTVEAQQLDELVAFCESYAQLRQQRQSQNDAAMVSWQFLHEAFLPHIEHIDPNLQDSPWFGWELDPDNQKISDVMKKRSNDIKWQLSAYRDELMQIYQHRSRDPVAKKLADDLGIYANIDTDAEDFEGPVDMSTEEKDFVYEAWKYSDEVWI